ncbi:eukaryotic translation initiation factor 2D [Pectinophora gossypiella]|uniref:eukaryotic translation initiation factor 2D n=1 Tax=Pectinophora gossypiella TaxID=13191 RepID=UPI00214F11D4|nr:eukaryotic translation initiation factor 2D [Pectinophora gossypiella]
MFAKPYKLKSTNTLKNSEKKHLAQRIQDEFPAATEAKVKELVPVKSSTNCLKLVLHSGEIVAVYAVDNVPVMIELETGLVPTVCALWKVPDLVPTITIHTPVLGKILGGAPLYLPGVVIPAQGVGFPMFGRGAILAACTVDNMAAGVVGRAAIGSADMLLRAAGVCLETIHVFGDQLCKDIKFCKLERPTLGPVSYAAADDAEGLADSVSELRIQPPPVKEEWPSLGPRPRPAAAPAPAATPAPAAAPTPAPPQPPPAHAPRLITEDSAPADDNDTLNDSLNSESLEEEESSIPEDMDGLLRWCLLCFLRLHGKNMELPLKTNLLYRNHLSPLCAPDRTLDVKKSSYKKMSKFLDAMQREGLLEVKEIEKGVDAVTRVNLQHPAVRATRVPAGLRAAAGAGAGREAQPAGYAPPAVREMLCVTAAVSELFHPVKKGTALTPGEVRTVLTEHVKARQLTAQQKGAVTLDATLAKIVNKQEQEVMKWDALISGVQSRMTPATEMRFQDGEVKLSKSRLEPITMQVAMRSGNKKVTLVSNLEAYGFSLPALSTACQHGVGAACGVTRSPGAKADQLMLQGDQTHFVAKLLIEKYGLPKKYVDGADKALNKKK